MASLQRYLKYDESVVLNISRVGGLRWQPSGWACPHGEERVEKHGDYREKRRAQRGERHKEGCAHCGLRVHAVIEFQGLRIRHYFCGRIRLSVIRSAIRRNTVSNTNSSKLSNPFRVFVFGG